MWPRSRPATRAEVRRLSRPDGHLGVLAEAGGRERTQAHMARFSVPRERRPTMQCPVLHRACQIGKWAATSPTSGWAATSPTSGWSARAARWRASSWQLPEKIFPGQSRKWIKQERRLPGRRERCDRQRAVSLLLLVTFSHPPLPCMVGLVFSLLQLRRGRVRSARSRASLLKRSQAVSTTIPRVSE